jgi:hypothetical protein
MRPATLCCTLALAGCATVPSAPTVLVLPGAQKSSAQFHDEQTHCQQQANAQVAPSVDAVNNQATGSAVVGTLLGAAVGALFGSPYYTSASAAWGAGAGLMVGSSVGAGGSQAAQYNLQQRYEVAFAQCMVALGNQLPGQADYRRVPRSVPPPNARPPSYPPLNTPPPLGVAPSTG